MEDGKIYYKPMPREFEWLNEIQDALYEEYLTGEFIEINNLVDMVTDLWFTYKSLKEEKPYDERPEDLEFERGFKGSDEY